VTRSALNPLARLLLAFALTLTALFGSVAFASAASADEDDRGSSFSQSDEDHDEDDDDEDKDGKDKDAEEEPPPGVVEYADGDAIDKLGKLVAKKAPQLTPKFESVAPQLRTLLGNHLTKQGATVTYDSRGQLVIAPYLCNPKKLRILQPGCVTTLPTPGGGRF
jgi:hypothetical protein